MYRESGHPKAWIMVKPPNRSETDDKDSSDKIHDENDFHAGLSIFVKPRMSD